MANYWRVTTSPENFAVSRERGFTVDGFRDNRNGRRVYGMKPGDKIVYYISKIQKFGAITEVIGEPYVDEVDRIWIEEDEIWPLRIPIKLHVALDDDQLVDLRRVAPRLSFMAIPVGQPGWGSPLQGSLSTIPEEDFEFLASEIRRAAAMDIQTAIDTAVAEPLTEDAAKEAIMNFSLECSSLHDRLGEMLQTIGTWMNYNAHTRHKVTPEHSVELDVAWLRGKNPDVAIEIQIGGSIVEAKDKLEQARRFNYRKVIMVIEEDQVKKLNDRIKFDELRFWLDAWSIPAVYRLYTAGEEFFSLYSKLDESRYINRLELDLIR